jgi:hypothetical protein
MTSSSTISTLGYSLNNPVSGVLDHGRGLLLSARLLLRFLALGRRGVRGLERLLEVGNDIVNVLGTDRDTDEIL